MVFNAVVPMVGVLFLVFPLWAYHVLVCVRSMVDTEMNKQKQTVSLWNSFLLGMERNEQKQ